MSKRPKFATGLRALVGEAGKALELDVPEPEPTSAAPAPIAALTVVPEVPSGEETAKVALDSEDAEPLEVELEPVAADEPKTAAVSRRRVKLTARELVDLKHMGTVETPYVRQRDNKPTRKMGFILPVELADEISIHAARTHTTASAFIEKLVRAEFGRLKRAGTPSK